MKQLRQVQIILQYSILVQLLQVVSHYCEEQWKKSKVISFLLRLHPWEKEAGKHSSAFLIWQKIRHKLTILYQALHLDRVFQGSRLFSPLLWAGLAIFCATILPTMAALGLLLLTFACFFLQVIRTPSLPLQQSPINAPCLLMASFYLGITITSVDFRASFLVGLLGCAFMLVPVLLENVANTQKKALLLTKLLVLSASLVSLYGLYQFIFGAEAGSGWVDTDMFGSSMVRVYSTLQNPNMLAQFLVLVLPFSAALLLRGENWNERFLWLLTSGVITLCLLCTYSRGGWVGALLAAGIFLLLLNPKLLLLFPFALVALYFFLPESILSRFTSIGNLDDSSSSYRVSIWMGSFALIRDYWFCGIGPGVETFNMIYPHYSYASANAQHSHNLFLQLMVDGGIPMLLLFLWVIFLFCRESFRFLSQGKDQPQRLFVIASVAGVGGFLAQGMTDYSFYSHRVAFAFWIALGLGLSWLSAKEE